MPLDTAIKKVLIIGSGPIVIGQAAEFDYSGTQACQALKSEAIEVVLVNSNPATIMTDKSVADRVYIEPIDPDHLEKIIQVERPDCILLGMGGQTALNIGIELEASGVLSKYNVKVIGTSIDSIKRGEDRHLFRTLMQAINQPVIESHIVESLEQGIEFSKIMGFPLILRPAYTLGGSGGGIADTITDFIAILSDGLAQSPSSQVLVEKSIKGWKEIEYEIVRDQFGNKVCVCNMENMDPVGVHTGDSIVVAPSQTLTDGEYQELRQASFEIVDAIEIIGGCNVQFAFNQETGAYAVIEVNPRVSRSSALASKATGYPIAKIAAKVALGYSLDEIASEITGVTFACFEPVLDYIVVKLPRFPFDKFSESDTCLGTRMKATGEVMAIGNTFEFALMKAIQSLDEVDAKRKNRRYANLHTSELLERVRRTEYDRLFVLFEALRRGIEGSFLGEITGIDLWFLNKLNGIISAELEMSRMTLENMTKEKLHHFKKMGFTDLEISEKFCLSPRAIYQMRMTHNIRAAYRMVDTCGGEFEAVTPYYYSVYGGGDLTEKTINKKIVILGSGPIRIGQGVEFDYASVHCANELKAMGYETIMINNNPETVSTDYSCADRLYFEPLTIESVMNVIDQEEPEGVVLQFGGQTAIQLAKDLWKEGIHIFGMSHEVINLCEDRHLFDEFLNQKSLKRPVGRYIESTNDGIDAARQMKFPVIIRPSYVIGGQGMMICFDECQLRSQLETNCPVWMDQFIQGKEVEVDVITDGERIFIPGIMEHVDPSGIHSGDSMTVYPPTGLSVSQTNAIVESTERIALGLGIKGILNIQYVFNDQELMVIEVNPRASRTVPIISKATGLPVVAHATRIMMGQSIESLGIGEKIKESSDRVIVKMPIFSTHKILGLDPITGPTMKSTGEIMGMGKTYEEALYKVFSSHLTRERSRLLVSMDDASKAFLVDWVSEGLFENYTITATEGTAKALEHLGVGVHNRFDLDNAHETIEVDLILNISSVRKPYASKGRLLRITGSKLNIPIFYAVETFRAWKLAQAFNKLESNVHAL